MSRAEHIFIGLGVVTVIIAGLTLWVALKHEQEHRRDLSMQLGESWSP
jgi:hypothetical protein